jgi:hypothetical protein
VRRAVVLLAAAVLAGATATASAKVERPAKTEETEAGGTHWRIESDNGPVHVWIPAGYDRETAGTVVYVHGYWTDVDEAWDDHDLAKQFAKSKQNAIFIAPEAPSSNDEDVHWASLAALRKQVTRANIRLPDGPTIVIGHSGAFRTIANWTDHKLVQQVILLDAMYGGQDSFDDFIDSGKRAKNHKLILIGSDTAAKSKAFVKKYPYAVVRDEIPTDYADFTGREKKAKLLYLRSQYGHGDIAAGGKVVPMALRLTPLAHL